MKNLFSALVFSLSVSQLAQADDWNQYRGNAGLGITTESLGNSDWAANAPRVAWKVPTPLGFSSLCVAGGRAFTIVARGEEGKEQEQCIALDAETGREIWHVSLGPKDYGHDGGNAGASY